MLLNLLSSVIHDPSSAAEVTGDSTRHVLTGWLLADQHTILHCKFVQEGIHLTSLKAFKALCQYMRG